MTTQDILLELNAARLAGEALSLVATIERGIRNKVNENTSIKTETFVVFERANDNKTIETKLEIKGKKPYKFKTKSNIKSIRVIGNLEVLKKKKALALNLKPEKQDVEQIATILQTIGTDIDIVLDIVNDHLVRVRLYKHNPKLKIDDIADNEKESKKKKQSKKEEAKNENYEIFDTITEEQFEREFSETDIFDLIDQIRQEYAFSMIVQESDILIEDINLVIDIKLDSDQKIEALLNKYKYKPDEIIIALVIYEYLKNAGVKVDYDLENIVTKEAVLFVDPDLFEMVYNENTVFDKIKFEKFLHTLPQKLKNALDALKRAVIKGVKAVASYLKEHHLELIMIMLLIGQIFLLTTIAIFGFLNFIGIPGAAILYLAMQQ